MRYAVIAKVYEKIEATSKRLEMTSILADFLRDTPKDAISEVVYLTQGKICPDFEGLEIGVAEKLAMKALARASGSTETEIEQSLKRVGDIGETAQEYMAHRKQTIFFQKPLTIHGVHKIFEKIATAKGVGAIELKISLLSGLLTAATPLEAKYLVRTATGNLRLGIADMTVLDALAMAYGGGKEARTKLERAYNVSADLGTVAGAVAMQGLAGMQAFEVSVGTPVRPMMAERLSSLEEILEKLGGKCAAEYKYDGERVQIHKKGEEVILYSRRLENISSQYPDAVSLVREHVEVESAILEAECVAVEPDTGEMKPFQELMHRRRKYGVGRAMEEYPISLFAFDALYVDGKDLTLRPYPSRRRTLSRSIKEGEMFHTARSVTTDDREELERFFLEAIGRGCEGLVCKSLKRDSVYQAGARGWLWIKYKRDYKSEMIDTVDLAVVGGYYGRGRRAGSYGALLLAAYNKEEDRFETVTKCGTGFSDDDLDKLPKMLAKHKIPDTHPRVRSLMDADIWFEPVVVLEVLGAEMTLSPIHVCALNAIRKGSGLAIRFPRFTGNYRFDKSAEDSTTTEEIVKMYRKQLRRVEA